ncbi:glycoside hydrolase family 3 protein [Melioribacter roseus P3M-2]|uniref:Glycoside hydrolase family 3 protein n=1 Tax=Melioribacter roseus (strain DSM 23840 / JCM 17771 / VKM B-2668 / P3M-2) TaxID=1191523 RepID=I6ZTW1_MELRP|nr:glycoside hydrolase family 3 C-terminal domain-containing protein [Melioribacter roseus]AFN75434.1 glycoside hydrolase family 3 protein [Melioribacter roseus P3M-2]
MKKHLLTIIMVLIMAANSFPQIYFNPDYQFKPFTPPIDINAAEERAEKILSEMSLEEKIQLVGGYNFFYVKGFEKYGIPQFYLSDATQGVHIRKELSSSLNKSVAFPCPLALTATWNTQLAYEYARCIGEECRAGDIAVLLGPGMNIYRISQNGRNFEYFGEDPFLAARMIENYVVGVQSTGTIATLKHFLCNNNEYHRRTTNAIVDERTIHEIYTPAFKAGIDAGALAVMTAYNQVNGEWAGQSKFVIDTLLRNSLGFKWLVMSDWWSTWDPEKTIKSGLDLEMPGDPLMDKPAFQKRGDITVKKNAMRLIEEGKVSEADIDRMAKNIMKTFIAMGLYDRPVKDLKYLDNFKRHEEIALQTARESIVLLKNRNNLLPVSSQKKILLTGEFVETLPKGGGSADVEGYDIITMYDALKNKFGNMINYVKEPSDDEIKNAEIVFLSVGTLDSEGWDRPFSLPQKTEENILRIVSLNPNTVVIVNSGGGIRMTGWYDKAGAILYAWYPGQNGNIALAEALAGDINPSGKLPMTIEKEFKDSPGYGYVPEDADLNTNWDDDLNMDFPINNIEYKEGVLVGYRWYDTKNIEPLFPFGFGLSYTTFKYDNLKIEPEQFDGKGTVKVSFDITNTGNQDGAEIAQLYVKDIEAGVLRPEKELKGFKKVFLGKGETKRIEIELTAKDFAYWDVKTHDWKTEPGEFEILIGTSSRDLLLRGKLTLK